ncbi:MAG TPA: pyridoxal-phosphate dependent enzyme [Candidatus Limnocylindrales bacterium]|nr:pyridoxal-phosphate dependent enzyme [Candidatus Limnocylindrales bacterium]
MPPRRHEEPPPPAVETALLCAGCGALAPAHRPFTPRCPNRHPGDDIDHVMARGIDLARLDAPVDPDPNPFVRYRSLFHAYHVARAAGWADARYVDLVRELDDAVAGVDGRGFRVTPLLRVPALARAAGLAPAGTAWVKDETGNVAGSHKARHLFGILLELRVAEALGEADPAAPLAIASCGNAALAAAVVARAAGRDLRVFVPEAADPVVLAHLHELGVGVVTCPRRPGETGDPSYLRLGEALAEGAVPFTCQGPDNGLAIEGGATLAWEVVDGLRAAGSTLDRIVVQVGGGALASGIALGFDDAATLGAIDRAPRLDTVQTRGAWPLARAHARLLEELGATPGVPLDAGLVHDALRHAATHRSAYMRPWETEPASVAHGILDDETYDWLAVERAMLTTGGRALVVDEPALIEANAIARAATGIDADETGTAGVAGLLDLGIAGHLSPTESVAVVLSGVRRTHPGKE